MWKIVTIASPSPLLHLTDKGIEQISSSSCIFSPSSRSSSSRAIPLFLPLRRYVDLLVSPLFHVAGVWSSADDSMHWLPMDCTTEAIDFEGGEEWELWARVHQMREQAGGAG